MSNYNNIAGQALGAVAGMAVTTLFQMDEAKKTKEFTNQLNNLSDAQKKKLDEALSQMQSQTAREKYLVEFVQNAKNEQLKKEGQKGKLILYAGLAIAVVGTIFIFIKLKQKK